MISLSKKEFKPKVILLSLLFVPLIVLNIIGIIVDYTYILIVTLLSILILYFVFLLCLKLYLKPNRKYMVIENDKIKFYKLIKTKEILDFEIAFEEIEVVDYYKITSLKAWILSLISYRVPKCVFLTLKNKDEKFIGYLELNLVNIIFQGKNIKIILH